MTKQVDPKYIVLYADDDEDDRELLEKSFNAFSSNVEIVTFVNGVEIIRYLEDLNGLDPAPCLIILDINMPLLNGKEALERIRGMHRYFEVPAILFTTSVQLADKTFAERHNAGFITKPIYAEQLTSIVEIFVDHCGEEVKKNIKRR